MSDFGWVKDLADAMRAAGVASCQQTSAAGETFAMTLAPTLSVALNEETPAERTNDMAPLERKRSKYAEAFGRLFSDDELALYPDEPGVQLS